ncbi:MAG: YiiX family permuted papain-like enzyme [Betaproteobacteria bacterium]|nr:YiiX family permuted papain-like enzyme [Betaproteobacteria bacterium]
MGCFRLLPWLTCIQTATGFFFLTCFSINGCAQTQPAVDEGDIIFHTSRSVQSQAIQQATGSRYSHMGIILFRQGKPYVFEASAKVVYTPLTEWIARGTNRHYVVKRLKTAQQNLTPEALGKLRKTAETFTGKPYDLTFEWSDERIYCSELVWKIYDRALGIQIGKLQKIREFNLNAPAVKQKIQERYGNNIPLEETVISPQAMFESPLLTVVAEK